MKTRRVPKRIDSPETSAAETLNYWIEQAGNAILQGQSMTKFVAGCHVEHRIVARIAYQQAKSACDRQGSL